MVIQGYQCPSLHHTFKLSMFDQERKKASFNKADLSHIIYGGPEKHKAYLKIQEFVANDPILKYDPSFLHQSRNDMINTYAKKMVRLHEFHDHFPLDGSTELLKTNFFTFAIPLSLHGIMFLTTLKNLCDQEQEKVFLKPALAAEIRGCYAQTELAHGSDVKNLMTTATYDQSTETFIIKTPDIGATKWWIGDLGLYCTHAAVFAQLIIKGKSYGVHVFLVPIRDPVTMKTYPGVEAGDIGPKLGFQNKDNGFAIFTNYRIPRRNMLMKYHVVSKSGEYSIQGNEKISYATMLITRSGITNTSFYMISKAVTILVRYSLVRKQFKNSKGQQIPILDYQTQQQKVIPRIAESYIAMFVYKMNLQLSSFVFEESKKQRFDRLNEAHIITSASKAILSYDILKGLQILRRAAGGHGFHMYNGVVGIMQEFSPVFTLEGQFTILMLQVARFLIKALTNLQKGKPLEPSVRYLTELAKGESTVTIADAKDLTCPYNVQRILVLHSCNKTQAAGQKIMKGLGEGLIQKQIWDSYAGLALVDAGIAHSYVIVYNCFLQKLAMITQKDLKNVMTKLLILFGLEKIIERSAKFFQTQTLTAEGLKLVYKQRQTLLAELRPEALTLVEAYDYDDNLLMSAIGASNGKPYQNLIDWAKRYNTMNTKQERDQVIASIKKAKSELRPLL